MGSREEISTTINNVGTSFVSVGVSGPAKYQIHRARAILLSGTGTSLALRVRQKDTAQETKLEYSLTAGGIDSLETADEILIYTKERSAAVNGTGTTYIGVQCDAGTTNSIYVALDIEVIT
jgi:hypothetical protein